jgi:hypothetical protein
MRSLLVEFHRFGKLNVGLLREGDAYLVAAASQPVCEVEMPLDYERFVDLMKPLRYKEAGADRAAALEELGGVITTLLAATHLADLEPEAFPLQLDLVVNAAELAALPFEAALDEQGQPLVVRGKNPIILTRRVRHTFAEKLPDWPARVRVLFAWAAPGAAVPHDAHETALRKAFSSWIPPDGPLGTEVDLSGVLEVLPQASLQSIRQACERAVEKKQPFTHVHLLGHGYPVVKPPKQMFGLALHDAEDSEQLYAATPEEIAQALEPLQGRAGVLTLAACDSANASNTFIPRRSIAHELHLCGFPVVIASQFPLTIPGSTVLIETFYSQLLAGTDVRDALYQARCALFENAATALHDWASVVSYVRLPEGYGDHLPALRLEAALTSLKAIQSWTDDLISSSSADSTRFERLEQLLLKTLKRLESFRTEQGRLTKGIVEENLGLLGSAEKRLAELYFQWGVRTGSPEHDGKMRAALKQSHTWYRQAFDGNLSHHWTGVQCLSLEVVLEGRISNPRRWHAAVLAAELAAAKPDEVWAWGSLAELYLLGPAAGVENQDGEALTALATLKQRATDPFAVQTTVRQLRRYVDWWTAANGFMEPSYLPAAATRLINAI